MLLWLLLSAVGGAQERHNFLAINGPLNDDAGPYYFVAQGDSANAFMLATPFAHATGLSVAYDSNQRELSFSAGIRRVVIDATSDIHAGLVRRPGVVRYDGGSLESPSAIIIDGAAYVPITPIVAALGGDSAWFAGPRVITIDLPDPTAGVYLEAPRIGVTDGVTRVAIDLPHAHPYQVAVNGSSLAILLPGVNAPDFSRALTDDPNLHRVDFTILGGVVALVVHTRHTLHASGLGYRVGTVPREQRDTVYIDFAPSAVGQAATPMRDGATALPPTSPPAAAAATTAATAAAPAAAATAPSTVGVAPRRATVVIDAGHGGRDPGAITSWATEKAVVLNVALMLTARLEAAGVEVILTRDNDTFLSLQERSTFATTDRTIFISIHANGADNRNANGIETFIFGRQLDPALLARAITENGGGDIGAARTAEAARIADDAVGVGEIVRQNQLNNSRNLAELVQSQLVEATGAVDRGVKQNLFYVIRNSRIPAILVELGFVTHAEEGRLLMQRDYQTKLANALADAVLEFLNNGGMIAAN